VSLKTGHHADAGAIFVRGSRAHKNGAALWVLREVSLRSFARPPCTSGDLRNFDAEKEIHQKTPDETGRPTSTLPIGRLPDGRRLPSAPWRRTLTTGALSASRIRTRHAP
jgi:hypothetical protein